MDHRSNYITRVQECYSRVLHRLDTLHACALLLTRMAFSHALGGEEERVETRSFARPLCSHALLQSEKNSFSVSQLAEGHIRRSHAQKVTWKNTWSFLIACQTSARASCTRSSMSERCFSGAAEGRVWVLDGGLATELKAGYDINVS